MQRVAISRLVRYATASAHKDSVMFDFIAAAVNAATPAADLGILLTGLLLGIRHGIDWDHIAAITDITSTTAAAGMAEAAHVGQHETCPARITATAATRRSGRTTRDLAPRSPPRPSRRDPPSGRPTSCPGRARRSDSGRSTRWATGSSSSRSASRRSPSVRCSPIGSTRSWVASSVHPRRPRPVGPVLGLPLRRRRRAVPPPEPLDARVRRHPPRLAADSRRGSTATSTSSRSR